MARRAGLRASDFDREQVAERLRRAAAEGRLVAEELEQRVAAALRARTYAELDPLVADLPGRSTVVRRGRQRLPSVGQALSAAAIVVAMVSVLAVMLVLITGLFAAWAMWALVAWWFFGRGRRGPRHGGPLRLTNRRGLL